MEGSQHRTVLGVLPRPSGLQGKYVRIRDGGITLISASNTGVCAKWRWSTRDTKLIRSRPMKWDVLGTNFDVDRKSRLLHQNVLGRGVVIKSPHTVQTRKKVQFLGSSLFSLKVPRCLQLQWALHPKARPNGHFRSYQGESRQYNKRRYFCVWLQCPPPE